MSGAERVCKAFRQNPDGSWTCTEAVSFSIPGTHIGALTGWTFKPGELHGGVDVAAWLTQNCARPGGTGGTAGR
jgi:hypothetical protein